MADLENKLEDIKEIKNYSLWEKVCKGYEISLKNLEQSLKEERPNAYIKDNEKNFGKEFLYNKWVVFGASIAPVCHPVLSLKMLSYIIQNKKKDEEKKQNERYI